ncbi:MAG: hypothetical protein ACIAXF_09520 [Phycisphaerales bacterium JB063]
MLSIQLIDKTLQQRDHDRLLRELCRNGLIMPLPLRVRLGRSAHGAAGLGLRRLVELTYGPTALSRELTDQLAHAIHPGLGVLDDDSAPCPVLTAAVCAGLGRLIRDHGQLLGEDLPAITQAHQHGIDALAQMQGHDGLFAGPVDRSSGDRLLVSAFIAYLLIDDHAFAARCRRHALLTALEEQRDHAEPQTADLIEMARMSGPASPQREAPQPKLPALAA